jgi:hypothetical protein
MLCQIWDFHGCDYEECHLLGYKTPVVPHRKHYVSTTEPSRLVHVRLEVFTAFTMKKAVFWDVAPCSCCQNRLLGERIASIVRVESCYLVPKSFLACWFFPPWLWRRYVPPKRRSSQEPHGFTFQKTVIFDLKIHCRVHKSKSLASIQNLISPVHTISFPFAKIHFNIIPTYD